MLCFFLWICVLKMVFYILIIMIIGKCKIVKLSYIKKIVLKNRIKCDLNEMFIIFSECILYMYMCK